MATIVSPPHFSPVEDAENIKAACQGWGTNEKAIISILGHRNLFQRKLIRQAYQEIYHEDLIHQLKSELSGNFERAICLWVLDPPERDALLAHLALQKPVPDYKVLVEIACMRSPEDLLAARRAYRCLYKRSLEEDLASRTIGDIRRLLVAMVSAYKYDGEEIDEMLAQSEAAILHDEILGKAVDHEETIRVLSTRSSMQLSAIFNRYKDIYGRSITKDLLNHPTNEYLSALRSAIRCIKNPIRYHAKVLRNSINTVGTDEDALNRVVVTRAEKDLKNITELYLKRNNVSLDQAIAKETSGDYKAFLLALLGHGEI
ncbi:Annexin repeat [Arabidopsis thaliana x Arabidopsis arenosa]|uniref:Annexin repeat n=1 Tax=Arabidopsis thaliana x Arabidopsis arenosa TaxID=1240361 RepID=A0A8T1YWD9_9BRAS|nr:Annexin repeat [Arabidopsis thaliana x Arabidopsis arenosa]